MEFLDRWKPDEFVHQVAAKLTVRLADAGRDGEVNELVVASAGRPHVQMAAAGTMFDYGIAPAADALGPLVTGLASQPGPFPWSARVVETHLDLRAVVWVLVHGLRTGLISEEDAARILDLHLPQHLPDSIGDRSYGVAPTSLLLAHALRARLGERSLSVQDVASAPLLALIDRDHISDHNARSFQANIPGLLPWVTCWLNALLDGDSAEVLAEVEALVDTGLKSVGSYDTPYVLVNGIAEIGTRVLGLVAHDELVTRFAAWHEAADAALQRSRLTISRIAAR